MGLLSDILRSKRDEVAALRKRKRRHGRRRSPVFVPGVLRGRDVSVVAEIKFKSPSGGTFSTALSAAARATAYLEGGAAMVSVLCDGPFFGGSWSELEASRQAVDARIRGTPIWASGFPLLAKEFVIDERQVEEAFDRGADAVLLIARLVSAARLVELTESVRALGMEPIVEVVTEEELGAAADAKATVIGVNARDLDTLDIDHDRAARVMAAVPAHALSVYFSGIGTVGNVWAVAQNTSANGVLVGEALMVQDDPVPLLRGMVASGRRMA